jgi:hypothetical protein
MNYLPPKLSWSTELPLNPETRYHSPKLFIPDELTPRPNPEQFYPGVHMATQLAFSFKIIVGPICHTFTSSLFSLSLSRRRNRARHARRRRTSPGWPAAETDSSRPLAQASRTRPSPDFSSSSSSSSSGLRR